MKTVALYVAIALFLIVFVGIIRTVADRRFPFLRRLDNETRQAYVFLLVAAVGLLVFARFDLHDWRVDSVEFAGVKASVGHLQEKVETLSEQMEVFFKRKRIETFTDKNWSRVRIVGKPEHGVILEVVLEQEPIPGSIEVYEGVLLMPEQSYHIDGKKIRFLANAGGPEDGLTIKYYPKVAAHE